MSQKYVQPLRIRFSHCDPAGIVYHPHYFTILNNLMEDFWRDVLGYGYEGMTERRMAFPVVGVHVDFCYPSRVGDECVMKCWIEHLGTSSIRFAMTIEGVDGTLRLQGTETVVCVKPSASGDGLESLPFSEETRAKLLPYFIDSKLTVRA